MNSLGCRQEEASRDEFICQMFDLNANIRDKIIVPQCCKLQCQTSWQSVKTRDWLSCIFHNGWLLISLKFLCKVAFEEARKYEGKVVLGDRPVHSFPPKPLASASALVRKGNRGLISGNWRTIIGSMNSLGCRQEEASRDEFICQMFDLNANIRKEQTQEGMRTKIKNSCISRFNAIALCEIMGMQRYEMDVVPFRVQNVIVNFSREPDRQAVKKVVTEVELRALEDILAHVASQTTKEEQEYIAEENNQTSELEQHYASLAEQLQNSQMRNYFRWSCHVTLFNLKRTCLYNCYNGCRFKVMEIVSPKFTVPNQSCCTKMATAIYDWIPKLSNDQSQTEIHGEGNGLDWCFCDPAWNSEDCDPSTVDSSGSLWDMN
ncbi:hypothetical protein OIU78_028522 [Salix suchowensis]|nr:hypothetical protein OIU78_028522 [Salix suchowensis]